LLLGVLGQVTRNQDKQWHVKDVDQPHHAMVDEIGIVETGDHVSQDDKDDQQTLDGVYSAISCHNVVSKNHL
jgi:hypothetical protein